MKGAQNGPKTGPKKGPKGKKGDCFCALWGSLLGLSLFVSTKPFFARG